MIILSYIYLNKIRRFIPQKNLQLCPRDLLLPSCLCVHLVVGHQPGYFCKNEVHKQANLSCIEGKWQGKGCLHINMEKRINSV